MSSVSCYGMSTGTEFFQQPATGSMQADRECGSAAAHDLRGFPRFQAIPRDQGQYFPVGRLEGSECSRERVPIRNPIWDCRPEIGRLVRLRIARLRIPSSFGGPPSIGENVPGGSQNPRERLLRHRVEAPPDDQEGFRDCVFRRRTIFAASKRVSEHARVAGGKDFFEPTLRLTGPLRSTSLGHFSNSVRIQAVLSGLGAPRSLSLPRRPPVKIRSQALAKPV